MGNSLWKNFQIRRARRVDEGENTACDFLVRALDPCSHGAREARVALRIKRHQRTHLLPTFRGSSQPVRKCSS
jgi:hypothetical protein